ncbi:MAG: PP2C family protein-serine/threonine phosphatase [Oleiphilus sp.]
MTKMLEFSSVENTHQGNVRKLNEDSILSRSDSGLWVVADGMGGHEAGELASQLIVSDLDALPHRAYLSDFVDDVEDTLLLVNKKLRLHSLENLNGQTVGSTVVSLILRENVGVVLWVGDSRLYRFRRNRLELFTKDHSEVQVQVDKGLLTQDQAENSAVKNMLSRAIGAFDDVDVDVNAFQIEKNDTFLLCSDGLYNEVPVTEMEKALKLGSLDKASDTLMKKCLESEARDNVSFILIKAG